MGLTCHLTRCPVFFIMFANLFFVKVKILKAFFFFSKYSKFGENEIGEVMFSFKNKGCCCVRLGIIISKLLPLGIRDGSQNWILTHEGKILSWCTTLNAALYHLCKGYIVVLPLTRCIIMYYQTFSWISAYLLCLFGSWFFGYPKLYY